MNEASLDLIEKLGNLDKLYYDQSNKGESRFDFLIRLTNSTKELGTQNVTYLIDMLRNLKLSEEEVEKYGSQVDDIVSNLLSFSNFLNIYYEDPINVADKVEQARACKSFSLLFDFLHYGEESRLKDKRAFTTKQSLPILSQLNGFHTIFGFAEYINGQLVVTKGVFVQDLDAILESQTMVILNEVELFSVITAINKRIARNNRIKTSHFVGEDETKKWQRVITSIGKLHNLRVSFDHVIIKFSNKDISHLKTSSTDIFDFKCTTKIKDGIGYGFITEKGMGRKIPVYLV